MVRRVASQEDGRVVEHHLELGRRVAEGDVLLELDSDVEEQRLKESLARVATCDAKHDAIRRQLEAETRAGEWQSKVDLATVQRAEADRDQVAMTTKHLNGLQEIAERLHDEQLKSTIDLLGVRKETDESRNRALSAEKEVSRLVVTRRLDESRVRVRVAELEKQLVDVEVEARLANATAQTAQASVNRRRVRASSSGKLGSIAKLQVGDVLRAGDAIATIIPADDLHVVAEFSPSEAVGRIVAGQTARVRLSGFAWTEFGVIAAVVRSVGTEPADGVVRVELAIAPPVQSAIPMQHGLPGAADIEIGRVAPWQLILRKAANAVGKPRPAVVSPTVAGLAQ
jgi:membrane fusion protein (multidrug efflux system)